MSSGLVPTLRIDSKTCSRMAVGEKGWGVSATGSRNRVRRTGWSAEFRNESQTLALHDFGLLWTHGDWLPAYCVSSFGSYRPSPSLTGNEATRREEAIYLLKSCSACRCLSHRRLCLCCSRSGYRDRLCREGCC